MRNQLTGKLAAQPAVRETLSDPLRALRRQAGAEPDQAYRAALLALHRGLDETDGRRVLADDLGLSLEEVEALRADGVVGREMIERARVSEP